jgi:hypothetical protein
VLHTQLVAQPAYLHVCTTAEVPPQHKVPPLKDLGMPGHKVLVQHVLWPSMFVC